MKIEFLTKEERNRFSLWLKQEANSDNMMSEELAKLNGHEAMVKIMKTRAACFLLVAKEINKIEEF